MLFSLNQQSPRTCLIFSKSPGQAKICGYLLLGGESVARGLDLVPPGDKTDSRPRKNCEIANMEALSWSWSWSTTTTTISKPIWKTWRLHCSCHRYLYHQGTQKMTGIIAGGAARPWLVHTYFKSAPPALPFDTPVTGIGHRPVVPHHHHIKGGLGVVHCFATEKETV